MWLLMLIIGTSHFWDARFHRCFVTGRPFPFPQGGWCVRRAPVIDYVPPLARLPLFLLRLATDVEWGAEQRCFDTLTQELADLYAFPSVLPNRTPGPVDVASVGRRKGGGVGSS